MLFNTASRDVREDNVFDSDVSTPATDAMLTMIVSERRLRVRGRYVRTKCIISAEIP